MERGNVGNRVSQWLRRRSGAVGADGPGAVDGAERERLLLAAAGASFPVAPAAYPSGYGCSCDRVGCPAPGMHPVSQAWLTEASTDTGRVAAWLGAQPPSNFITATGRAHDVLDVPAEAGRLALERFTADGRTTGPVARYGTDRVLFFTATRGTPEDEDEWWPCELDCRPEALADHPGLRWHCRGSYVMLPPSRLPGGGTVEWLRPPDLPLPDPLTLLDVLGDACSQAAAEAERAERAESRR